MPFLLIAVILLLGYEIFKTDPLERLQASGERFTL